jgi:hypothetical protein
MSSFAGSLVHAASSAASAYLQFIQEAPTGEFVGFIFVEDKPDISVYRHFIEAGKKVTFYPCGGKGGVLTAYEKLSADNLLSNTCFIVDKDFEEAPYAHEDVLRTSMYSWESHVCESDAVRYISDRKCHPAWMDKPLTDLTANWEKSLEKFRAVFAQHTALLKTGELVGGEFGLSKIPILKGSSFIDGVLIPGEDVQIWLNEMSDSLIEAGVGAAEIGEITTALYAEPTLIVARGKTLLGVLRRFLQLSYELHGKEFLGDIGDAVRLVETLPPDWASLDYVKGYITERIP